MEPRIEVKANIPPLALASVGGPGPGVQSPILFSEGLVSLVLEIINIDITIHNHFWVPIDATILTYTNIIFHGCFFVVRHGCFESAGEHINDTHNIPLEPPEPSRA